MRTKLTIAVIIAAVALILSLMLFVSIGEAQEWIKVDGYLGSNPYPKAKLCICEQFYNKAPFAIDGITLSVLSSPVKELPYPPDMVMETVASEQLRIGEAQTKEVWQRWTIAPDSTMRPVPIPNYYADGLKLVFDAPDS